jgi:hypothetical protein
MGDRVLSWTGRASTGLLTIGLAILLARPDSAVGARAVYVGVTVLMLTPMTRVLLALARSVRADDTIATALAAAILAVVAASVFVAFGFGS